MSVSPPPVPIYGTRLLGPCVLVVIVLLVISLAIQVPTLGAGGIVLDFDAFYIAGQMGWEGDMAAAYDKATMLGRQSALAGKSIWMPWSYPPQFDLITMALSSVARGLSYLLFMTATFVPFVLVLRRIAGPYLPDVLFLGLPAFLITTAVGQNGFLSGLLMGLFALAWQQGRTSAGAYLGCMVIKPHLALGAGALALLSGRWRVAGLALAIVVGTSALATLVFGPQIWTAFLEGTKTASLGMKDGYYPMYRMTSAYAFLATLGLPPNLALAGQIGVALASFAVIFAVSRLDWPAHRVLGLTLIASMGISPYNYDYDTPIMVVGLALLLPDLAPRLGLWGRRGLFLFTWLASGWGQVTAFTVSKDDTLKGVDLALSLGVVGVVGLALLVWRTLCHEPAPAGAALAA